MTGNMQKSGTCSKRSPRATTKNPGLYQASPRARGLSQDFSCSSDDPHRIRLLVPILLSVLPFLVLVAAMIAFHLDFPYLDQWELVPLLEKSYDGSVTLGDLWAQHNEHRLIFPRLIMLGLAHLSHWNIAWELAANVVLGTGIFLVLATRLWRTAAECGKPNMRWLIPSTALLVFSLNQWENWFLGWQLQEFLNVLAVVLGLSLAADGCRCRIRLWSALVLGVVATYSFANGMFFWPIGLAVLWAGADAGVEASTRRRRVGLWLIVGAATAATYLYDYHTPEYHPSLASVLGQPVEYALYVLKYLGAPMANFYEPAAALAGLVGITAACVLTWKIMQRSGLTQANESPSETGLSQDFSVSTAGSKRVVAGCPQISLQTLAPYLGFALYALASAAVTGVGRVGFGSTQAMSPRYIAFANLLWVAVFAMAGIQWRPLNGRRRFLTPLALALLAMLMTFDSAYGGYRWTERYNYRIEVRDELIDGDDLDKLRRIHPEPSRIIERRPVLRRLGLSIFGTQR